MIQLDIRSRTINPTTPKNLRLLTTPTPAPTPQPWLWPATTLVQITYYTSPNYVDHPQVNVHWIHCIEYSFTVQDFRATWACPEKFHCTEYTFYIPDLWATCACPEKQLQCNFSLYWNIFIIQDFWATCAYPENRVGSENFQAGGDGSHPTASASCAYV